MNLQQSDQAQTDVIGSRKHAQTQFNLHLTRQDAAPASLIVYYGAPGSGKAALLKKLQDHCDEPAVSVPWTSLDLEKAVDGRKIETLCDAIVSLSKSLDAKAEKYPKSSLSRNGLKHCLRALQLFNKIVDSSNQPFSPLQRFVQHVVKHSSLAPAANTVYLALQLGSEAAIINAVGSLVIFNAPLFEALSESAYGHHSQNLKAFKEAMADEAQLNLAFCSAFASVFPARKDGFVKAVLFLDVHEMAVQSTRDTWVRQICLLLQQQGILCVVSSENPFPEQANTVNIPILGLTSMEAESDVRERLSRHLEGKTLDSMTKEVLAICRTKLEDGQRFYPPSRLNACFDGLKIKAANDNQYPKSLNLSNSQEGVAKRLIDFTFSNVPAEHQCIRKWLQELTVAPMFDEEFARELYAKRIQGGNASGDWSFLRELSILASEEVKEGRIKTHIFYNMSDIYRRELVKGSTEDDKQNIHKWSVEHWLVRADEMFSQDEYDLYKMERPYWQGLMSNCLFHLNALEEHASHKTLLLITKLLLDFYWWWCENLPHDAWHEMFGKIAAVTGDKQGNISKVLELFARFDAAWPKRWQLNPQNWKSDDMRTDEEKPWNYAAVLDSVQKLRSLLNDNLEDVAEAEFDDLNDLHEYIAAMLSYYEGLAYHYGALTDATLATLNLSQEKAFQASEEALKHYGDWFNKYRPRAHGKLKHTWSLIARADLHTDTKDYASATSYANQALGLISEFKKQEGVQREGASSAYQVLAAVATRQGEWGTAGQMMGRALIYGFGFYALDPDDYAYAYHCTYQRECIIADLTTARKSSPSDMLAYLHGFQAEWQMAPVGTADAVPEKNLEATFEALPIKLDRNPGALTKTEFEAAEAEFGRLDKEIKRKASQLSSPMKSS